MGDRVQLRERSERQLHVKPALGRKPVAALHLCKACDQHVQEVHD